MPVSFLFSNKVMNEAFSSRNEPFAVVSRQAINKASEIFQDYDGCFSYTPTQVYHSIRGILDSEQQVRFENAINIEGTTQGVAGYNADTINTLWEASKKLSLTSYTITIVENSEKIEIEQKDLNKRIKAISPTEFLSLCDEAKDLTDVLTTIVKGSRYLDFLILILFRKDIHEILKKFKKV